DHAALARWRKAAEKAYNAIRYERREKWVALVGVDGQRQVIGDTVRLRNDGAIGDLKLYTAKTALLEYFTDSRLNSSATRMVTWPIRVIGESVVDSMGSPKATDQLRRLCLVLSVKTQQRWIVRTYATTDIANFQIPTRSVFDKQMPMYDEDDDVYATRVKASGWMSSAYHLLDRDPEMLSAANMYYEGISVLPDHPSLAFVCFVSVVETLSVRKHGYPDRCRF